MSEALSVSSKTIEGFKGRITEKEPLSNHTTFRIGGPCDIWAEPEDAEDLKNLIIFIETQKIPYFVIGNGSNILAKDEGFKGIVIRLSSDSFKKVELNECRISAGAGAMLPRLCNFAQEAGLAGFESLVGIPATVGGAIAGNAGGSANSGGAKKSIGDLVEEVEVLDDKNRIKILKKQELEFGYRTSNLQGSLILGARFLLEKEDPSVIQKKMEDFLQQKAERQELELPSAGCVFKNPEEGGSAGELIDKCGLKDVRIRGAKISSKHANFIVNLGTATCADVLLLMDLIKKKVKQDKGVLLKEEVKILK